MRKRKDKGRIGGPFVPMLNETMKSAAWRAMSPYARVVYIALKSRYGIEVRNNGRIYLSARAGAEETGFDMKTVARGLRELKHYGFIVMTESGCLGVEGKGKAAALAFDRAGYMHDPPTKDFLKWDGELFYEQKSPRYYTRKKQNPVPSDGTRCTAARHIQVYRQTEQSDEKLYRQTEHTDDTACTVQRHISRLTTRDDASAVVPDDGLDIPDHLRRQ